MSEAVPTPVVPPDYYRAIAEVDQSHWWHRGMLEISRALLGARLDRPGLRLLDAGCGTGGFLLWACDTASLGSVAGVDVSDEALRLAQARLPGVDLHLAPVSSMPFADAAFDLVVLNDVLQHIREDDVERSLLELRRVLAPGGALLVRTNARRPSAEWRIYDVGTLAAELERAGLAWERLTHANLVGSLWAAARGWHPSPPSATSHGVPAAGSPAADGLKLRLLRLEARYLSRPGRSLPYGHTLFALAIPARS